MKVLVSAASKHGSTAEIAVAIARRLGDAGHDVTRLEPNDVAHVEHYDAFVIGSGVYAGHWLAQGKDLVHEVGRHAEGRPVWLFSSGPLGPTTTAADAAGDPGDTVDVSHLAAAVHARGHQVFSGKLDKGVLGFAERAIVAAVRAPDGDFRDWAAIDAWATDIAGQLVTAPA
jgi:menaquinone-dependent protoporphyrinogen oxidase